MKIRTLTKKAILTVIASVAVFASPASAANITTLYNTGVDGSGTPLADDTVGDPHYTLIATPANAASAIRVRTQSGGYPVSSGTYILDTPDSAWIGPNSDHYLNGPIGNYTYRTTFDLTGFNPLTAAITGKWSTDNFGFDILLNGVSLGLTNQNGFSTWTSFSIPSGSSFVAGINTLDFIVDNQGGPTALRVEMTGTAEHQGQSTPDAGSTLFLLSGIVSVFGMLRRKIVF